MAIDFRVRPPFRSFRDAFGRRSADISDETAMQRFLSRLDEAGIDRAVAVGRFVPQESPIMAANVTNADVAALVARYPDRFVGIGAVDVRDIPRAIDEVNLIAELGLRGVAFDNPLSLPARYDDDEELFPIYAEIERRGLIAAFSSSAMIGHDISYSDPVHIQRVGLAFPSLTIVIPHASWPWTTQLAAVLLHSLMTNRTRIFALPDVYLNTPFTPGRSDYLDGAQWGLGGHRLAERLLFASSYPAQDPVSAIEEFRKLDFGDDTTRDAILYGNAEHLLGTGSGNGSAGRPVAAAAAGSSRSEG